MTGQALLAYGVVIGALCLAGWIFTVYDTIKIHKDKHV